MIAKETPGNRVPDPREGKRAFVLYLACAGTVVLLLSLYYLIRHRAFAFDDIGIDSFAYYYAFQMAHARQLHELHTMTWSFSAGLGSYIGWMSNALIWFNALFPESWQLSLRLPTYCLRLLLAGGFMFGYLRKLGFEPRISTAGALAFAFCGYAMVNGQWDSQGYFLPQAAAYLFCFESYFRQRKAGYAVAAGVLACSGAVFDTYTFTLLSVLYVITRPLLVSKGEDAAPYLPSLFRYAGWAALGAMLTAVILLPNMIYLLSSPRVSGDHSIMDSLLDHAWTLNGGKVLAAEAAGMFGKSMLGTASRYAGYTNWFEAPGFYVGILMLSCIPQLIGPHATRREKWVFIIGALVLLIYMLWPFMRFAVYGFGHRGFRMSTLWVSFGLLILGVAGLRRIYRSGSWRTGLVGATVAIVALVLVIAARLDDKVNFKHLATVIGFALVYCALLWPSRDGKPRANITVIVIVLACELLLFALPPMLQRSSVTTDGTSRRGNYFDGTEKALALTRATDHSGEFYRIAKTYRSIQLNSAMVLGYSGTSSYFFHGASITRFVDHMGLPRTHPRTNYIARMTNRPKVLDLLGVKYVFSRNHKLDKVPDMSYVGSTGGIRVYRNTDAHGVAHIYRHMISEETANAMSKGKRDSLLGDTLIVTHPGQLHAKLAALDKTRPGHGETETDKVSLQKLSDVHLRADVTAKKAGILLIAMPFDQGWSASLNRTGVPLLRVDYGLTALIMPAGHHVVDFHYSVPGRRIGTWLSLSALLILLAAGAFFSIRKRTIHDVPTRNPG